MKPPSKALENILGTRLPLVTSFDSHFSQAIETSAITDFGMLTR